jgi:hypothetical protein
MRGFVVGLLALLAPAVSFTTSTNRLSAAIVRSRSQSSGVVTMKLFDWKRREANEDCEFVD